MSATPMSSQAQPLKVFLCHGWGDTAVRELYRR
jgi:hypothetical protein